MEDFRIDPTIAYDVVPLATRGIFYGNNKKNLKVAYLTASDENILSSQNLLDSGQVLDELLRRKIIDRDIEIEDLHEEDRQVILIFLRNTAFGSEYKLSALDPKTNKEFDFTLDLSELKTKEFNLIQDSNGDFPYRMNKSNVDITFNFLTPKHDLEIQKIQNSWKGSGFPPIVTKQLEFMIKSVNGNRDPMVIYQFIQNLPIKDSQDFRKFVKDNKPGLDLTHTIKTPSGEDIQVKIGFGVEFFRPFYGI
jgi:hypothetical protein